MRAFLDPLIESITELELNSKLPVLQADNIILQKELLRMRSELSQVGRAAGVPVSTDAPELQKLSCKQTQQVGLQPARCGLHHTEQHNSTLCPLLQQALLFPYTQTIFAESSKLLQWVAGTCTPMLLEAQLERPA